MLCSFYVGYGFGKIQIDECLFEMAIVDESSDVMQSLLTVFSCNTLAKCLASLLPMLFHGRVRLVNVFMVEKRWMRKETSKSWTSNAAVNFSRIYLSSEVEMMKESLTEVYAAITSCCSRMASCGSLIGKFVIGWLFAE